MAVKLNPLNSIVVSGPIPAHLARAVIEETLRNAILDGRLPCGTAIRQEALAQLFGVSRMPVREALRLSVPLLTDEDFETADSYIEALESETDFGKIGTLNRQFHQALYCRAPNRKLLALIEAGLIEEERFLRFNLEQMDLGKLCQDDHRALLRHARARDVESCIAELELHLQRGVTAITHYLNTQNAKQP